MVSSISGFLPYLLPQLPGAPADFVSLQVKAAARRFFDETEVWQKELDSIDLVADQASYDLDPGVDVTNDAIVRRIVWAKVDDSVVDHEGYALESKATDPFFQITFQTGYIPTTSTTDGLDVRVTLLPDINTDVLPDFLLNRYFEGIRSMALYDLFSMTDTKWHSPEQATKYRRQTLKELSFAKRERFVEGKEVSIVTVGQKWL